jgi:hypothetical protein
MRLGWLSRLGIVLTAFGLPIAALSLATYENAQITELRTTLFNSCMKVAQDALPEIRAGLSISAGKSDFHRSMRRASGPKALPR